MKSLAPVDSPSVSVIVPVFNGLPALEGLLTSLRHITYPKDKLEILIVDNGSTDGSAQRTHQAAFATLIEPRRGASSARNAGVKATRGEILAFTDADCIVTRSWLRALVEPFADQTVGGVGGRTETYLPRTAAERHAVRTRQLDAELHLSHPTFPFMPTANAAFRRTVFERIGGFDPDFPWGEPIDFCKRVVRDSGLRLAYAPRAVVFHRARSTVSAYYRQQLGYGYSLALLCNKYREEARWTRPHSMAADWELFVAGLLLPVGLLESAVLPRRRHACEARWLELVRQYGRRKGFRRAVRERGLKLL